MIYNNIPDIHSRQSRPKYHSLISPQVIPVCSLSQPQFINPLLTARPVTSSAITQRSVSPIPQQFNIIHPSIMHAQPKQILETNPASVPLSQRVFSVEIQQTPSVLQPFRNVLQPKQTNIIRSCQNLNGIQPLCCPSTTTQILKANSTSIPLPMQSMKILNPGQFLIQRGIKNQENGDPTITGQLPLNKTYLHNTTRSQCPPNNTAHFQQQISSNVGSQKVITVTNNSLRVSDKNQIMNRHAKSASCHSKITGNNNQAKESQRGESQNNQSLQQQKLQYNQLKNTKTTTTTQTRRSSFTLCSSKRSNDDIQIKSVGNDQECTQTQLHSCNEIIQNHGSRICQTEENAHHKHDRNITEKVPLSERNLQNNNESEIIARMVDNDIQEIQEQYKVQIRESRDEDDAKTFETPDKQHSQCQDQAITDTIQLLNKEKDEKVKLSKPLLTYNLTPVHFEDHHHHHLPNHPQELKELVLSSQISLTERQEQSQRNKSPVHQIFTERNLNEQQADTTQDKSISKEHATSNDYSPHQTPQKVPKQQINYDQTISQVDEQNTNPSAISALPQNPSIIQITPDRHIKTKLNTHQPQEQLPSQSNPLSQEQAWSLDKLEKEAETIKNSMSPELYFTLKDIQGQDSNNRGQKLKCLQADIEKRVEGALPTLKEKEVKGISQAIYDSVFHLLRKKYSINVTRQAGEAGGANNKKQERLETRSSKNEKFIEKLSKGRLKDARDEMKRNKARSLSTQGVFQASKFCLSPIQEMESFAEQLQASKFTTEKKMKNEEDKGENIINRQIKAISSWEDNIKQMKCYQVEAATQQLSLAQKVSQKMDEYTEQPTIELSVVDNNNNCIRQAISPKLLSNYHLPIFSDQKRSSTPQQEAAKSSSFFGQISCITTNNQNNSNQNLFSECNIPDSSYPDILLPSSAKMNLQFNSINSSPNLFKQHSQKQESYSQNYKSSKNTAQSTPKSQQVPSISQKKSQVQVANTKENNYTKEYLRKCSKDKKKKEENDYQRIKSTLMANFQKAQQGHLKELQQTMKGIQSRKASRSEHTQS